MSSSNSGPLLKHIYDFFTKRLRIATLCNMIRLITSLLPSSFNETIYFSLTLTTWVSIFVTVLIGLIVSSLLSKIIASVLVRTLNLKKVQSLLSTENSNVALSKPLNLMILGWIFLLGISSLTLPENIIRAFTVSAKILTFSGLTWLGFQIADIIQSSILFKAQKTKSKFDDLLAPLFGRALKIFILIFVIISVAEIFNLPLSSLLAGLGIGGIAIAMAAKDTIANIFGSLTVLVDRPFHIGDWVVIDGTEGTVEDVGFRSTRIRTFYDSVITIPNSLLLTAKVDNMGSRTYRRIKETLGITYQTSPEKVETFCEEIKAIIANHNDTRKDYYLVNFTGFKDSHLEILLYCFVKVPNWEAELDAKQDILLTIARKADQLGIEFAYPTQTLFINKND